MIRIIINGAMGKMGRAVAEAAVADPEIETVAGVDTFAAGARGSFPLFETLDDRVPEADVLVDFSRHDATREVLAFATKRAMPVIIATTAHTPEEQKAIEAASKVIPIFKSANMSVAVNVLIDLCGKAAAVLHDFDAEIVEKHHNTKGDAPSGTALHIADAINTAHQNELEYIYGRKTSSQRRDPRELGIHAVRGGTIIGEHEVIFIGGDETLIIEHRAQSRRIYAFGALRAVRYMLGREAGLYDMQDLLLESSTVTSMIVDDKQAIITTRGVKNVAAMFGAIAKINIDMISQIVPTQAGADISFTLPAESLEKAAELVREWADSVSVNDNVTKITVEGLGMERQSGVAAQVFSLMSDAGVQPLLITTSETKISICIPKEQLKAAKKAIKETFLKDEQ